MVQWDKLSDIWLPDGHTKIDTSWVRWENCKIYNPSTHWHLFELMIIISDWRKMDIPCCFDVHSFCHNNYRVRKEKHVLKWSAKDIHIWKRYGNIVPVTQYGKIASMIYAVFGIPVYILYFRSMGKVICMSYCHRQLS